MLPTCEPEFQIYLRGRTPRNDAQVDEGQSAPPRLHVVGYGVAGLAVVGDHPAVVAVGGTPREAFDDPVGDRCETASGDVALVISCGEYADVACSLRRTTGLHNGCQGERQNHTGVFPKEGH